jgi:hypothetical protein
MAVTFDREQYPFLDKVKNQPGRGTMWTPDFDNHFPHVRRRVLHRSKPCIPVSCLRFFLYDKYLVGILMVGVD